MSDFAYWLQISLTVGPMLVGLGMIFEKVRQIEKRLNGNGASIPGRCNVHEDQLGNLNRRVEAIEEK